MRSLCSLRSVLHTSCFNVSLSSRKSDLLPSNSSVRSLQPWQQAAAAELLLPASLEAKQKRKADNEKRGKLLLLLR